MDTVDSARDQLRTLHKKLDAATAKNRDTLRADLQDAGAQAQRIAGSLKTLAGQQRTDASDRLAQAASALEKSAANAKNAASANDEKLRQTNQDMLAHTRQALQQVSEAVAAKRAALQKHA